MSEKIKVGGRGTSNRQSLRFRFEACQGEEDDVDRDEVYGDGKGVR